MHPTRSSAAFRLALLLLIPSIFDGPAAQQRLVDDVTAILGSVDHDLWFARQGTVWTLSGAGHRFDTRLPAAQARFVTGGELVLDGGDRIHLVSGDGSSITRAVPFGYDDVANSGGVLLWRSSGGFFDPRVESFRWNGSGWSRHLVALSDPMGTSSVEASRVRPDRYLLLWSSPFGTDLFDMFRGYMGQPGTETGTCFRILEWSGGAVVCSEDPARGREAYIQVVDQGAASWFPVDSGWGYHRTTLREDVQGRPWLQSDNADEYVAFLVDERIWPAPGQTTHTLFYTRDGSITLADATLFGQRRIVARAAGEFAWNPVLDLAGLDRLDLLLETDDGRLLLTARDPASGYRLIGFDAQLGGRQDVLVGLSSPPRDAVEFADGVLFVLDDGSHGAELWFSRGSSAATWLVADLLPGSAGSNPRQLTVLGSRTLFLADGATGASHLYSLDARELDWRRHPTNGHYYRLTPAGSWREVEREARRMGGTLATIRSAAEQDWLWSTFGPRNLWIGLQDFDRDGSFEWISGEPLSFTAWCPGEPGATPLDEDTVHLADYPGFCDGGWNDQGPEDRYQGIVERVARPAAVESFGGDCAATDPSCGSLGPCTLEVADGVPEPGVTMTLVLDTLQQPFEPSDGFLLLGTDNASWSGVELPFDLAPFGWAAGCRLLVAPLDALPIGLDRFGRGSFVLSIPGDPVLAGARLFLQGLALHSRAGCSEASAGLRMQIGG